MKFSRLILANLFRKKVRLTLTLGSFAVALFLFAFLAVVKYSFSSASDLADARRLVTFNRTSLIQPVPISYRDRILAIRGVQRVTHDDWFGGIYQDEKNFFPQFVIDPENQRQVFPELIVPDDQWNAFLNDRQGAIVGVATARRFGWKIGDRIPLQTTNYGGGAWEFNIQGIYHGRRPGDDESQFWFQWDYFEERVPARFKGRTGWYTVKLASPDDAVRVARTIDADFANSPCETRTQTESAFAADWVKQFGDIETLILVIGSVVFFTLLLVTGNTMAISVRERTGEFAILKALGFKNASILMMVLAESLAVALGGGLLGVGMAKAALPILSHALSSFLPRFMLSPSMVATDLAFALLVGAISGLLPGIAAMRLQVVQALRRI